MCSDEQSNQSDCSAAGCGEHEDQAAQDLWCAMCGKWSDHRSGGCPELSAVRGVQQAVDRINSMNEDMSTVINLFGWISIAHVINWNEELTSIAKQLSIVAEQLKQYPRQDNWDSTVG